MPTSEPRIPRTLTLLLCKHAAITLTRDVSMSCAGVFHAREGDQLFLAGTYDGPLGAEGLKARVLLKQGDGRTRVASVSAIEMVLQADEEYSEVQMVRVPLVLQLPPVPDLTAGIYMWDVHVQDLKSKISFVVTGGDEQREDLEDETV